MKPKSLPSRLFSRQSSSSSASSQTQSVSAAKYQRHVDCVDHLSSSSSSSSSSENSSKHRENYLRELKFAFQPDKYEILREEDEDKVKKKEEKKQRKKENYKKVKKNVGKALRSTWKCFMLGMYNFAMAYTTPINMAGTFVPDFHQGRDWP
ncbi:unnamed protein product [Ophioblennius macclurei]